MTNPRSLLLSGFRTSTSVNPCPAWDCKARLICRDSRTVSAIDENRPCSVSFWRLSRLRSSKLNTTRLFLDMAFLPFPECSRWFCHPEYIGRHQLCQQKDIES